LYLNLILLSQPGHFRLVPQSVNGWFDQVHDPVGTGFGFWWSEITEFRIISAYGHRSSFQIYVFPCKGDQLTVA
jgi:hypothetical protein